MRSDSLPVFDRGALRPDGIVLATNEGSGWPSIQIVLSR